MFPMTVTVTNQAQLAAVMAALGAASCAAPAPAQTIETPAKQEAPKAEAPKPQAAPAAAKPEAASTPPTAETAAAPEQKAESSEPVSFDELKKAFLALAGKNREAAVKLLADNGCAKLTEAKPEQFAALHDAIQKALG